MLVPARAWRPDATQEARRRGRRVYGRIFICQAGKEILRIGLSLHAAGGAAFLEYTCSVSGAATVGGSVIVPVRAGKMLKASTLQFVATAGKQKPEAFEGGVREVLTNQLGEQVGLTLSAGQVFEQAIEINPLF